MIQPTRRLVLALAAGFPLALLPVLTAPALPRTALVQWICYGDGTGVARPAGSITGTGGRCLGDMYRPAGADRTTGLRLARARSRRSVHQPGARDSAVRIRTSVPIVASATPTPIAAGSTSSMG